MKIYCWDFSASYGKKSEIIICNIQSIDLKIKTIEYIENSAIFLELIMKNNRKKIGFESIII